MRETEDKAKARVNRSKSYRRLKQTHQKRKKQKERKKEKKKGISPKPLRGAASDAHHHLLDLVVREVFARAWSW